MTVYEIPKECKAGVVVDEGPNFWVDVQMVSVPEIGNSLFIHLVHPCKVDTLLSIYFLSELTS